MCAYVRGCQLVSTYLFAFGPISQAWIWYLMIFVCKYTWASAAISVSQTHTHRRHGPSRLGSMAWDRNESYVNESCPAATTAIAQPAQVKEADWAGCCGYGWSSSDGSARAGGPPLQAAVRHVGQGRHEVQTHPYHHMPEATGKSVVLVMSNGRGLELVPLACEVTTRVSVLLCSGARSPPRSR